MSRAAWSAEDRQEFDLLMQEVCTAADSTEDRVNRFEAAVADAMQAQRFWAGDVRREAIRTGHREQIKTWLKVNRVIVQIKDRTVSKPRVAGVKRLDEAGESYDAYCGRTGMSADKAYRAFHLAKAQLQACVEHYL